MSKLLLALALTAFLCPAKTLYSNTDSGSDQGFSVFYSANGYTEIGDQIQLTSAGFLTSLGAQFYNGGSTATFDAVLRFYAAGSPVGTLIGAPFTVTGISIAGNTSQNVTFSNLGNLAVPLNLIVTLAVANVTNGGDLGVNLANPPPTVGASAETFFIAYDGTTFSQAFTGLDIDNVYLEVNGGSAVPEPGTAALTLGALAGLVWFRRGRRSSTRQRN